MLKIEKLIIDPGGAVEVIQLEVPNLESKNLVLDFRFF